MADETTKTTTHDESTTTHRADPATGTTVAEPAAARRPEEGHGTGHSTESGTSHEHREHHEGHEHHEAHEGHEHHEGHTGSTNTAGSGTATGSTGDWRLLSDEDSRRMRERWESIQASFIDEPRGAVEEADRLVSDATDRVAEGFQRERGKLEEQWSRGDEISTEELRQTLKRYRSFFDRLLSL